MSKQMMIDDFDSSSGCDVSFESRENMDLAHVDNTPPRFRLNASSIDVPPPLDYSKKPTVKITRDDNNASLHCKNRLSPPYKKIRALCLFDSPRTPNTIIEHSMQTPSMQRKLLFSSNEDKPHAVPTAFGISTITVNPFTPNGMPQVNSMIYALIIIDHLYRNATKEKEIKID